jgi:hypothetical protein
MQSEPILAEVGELLAILTINGPRPLTRCQRSLTTPTRRRASFSDAVGV